jgi:hypothetical protein
MTDEPIPYLQEKVLAGSLLTSGAGKAASVIDTFVSWLLAGTGGALALLIGNLADVVKYVPLATLKSAACLFLFAACLTVVEKYLASVIVGAAESSAHAAEVGRRLADEEIKIDFNVVFREFEAATLPPMRWFVARSLAKARSGDFAASGRNFARCTQIQGVLALGVSILVLWAMGLVVSALGG